MFDFHQRVESLRQYESLCYKVCMTLLIEEQRACSLAEQVLCRLFAKDEFWKLEEALRPAFILRICTKEYIDFKRVSEEATREYAYMN